MILLLTLSSIMLLGPRVRELHLPSQTADHTDIWKFHWTYSFFLFNNKTYKYRIFLCIFQTIILLMNIKSESISMLFSKLLLTRCSSEVVLALQNVLLLVLPITLLPPALLLSHPHLHPSVLLSLRAGLRSPRGDGSPAPQLCGCRTGAVTFKPSISTLSLPELSVLSARHKGREERGNEGGRWE